MGHADIVVHSTNKYSVYMTVYIICIYRIIYIYHVYIYNIHMRIL